MISLARAFRVVVILVVGATVAEAQLPGQARAQQPTVRLRTALPGYPDPIALDTVANYTEMKAAPGVVFNAAVEAFKTLDIPVTVRDSIHGTVGNLGWIKLRQLAGKTMSTSFNCGSGMTGPNADAYRLTIAAVVMIDALPNGNSRVGVALVGSAQDVQGASKDPVACGSNGYTEGRIEALVRAKLTR